MRRSRYHAPCQPGRRTAMMRHGEERPSGRDGRRDCCCCLAAGASGLWPGHAHAAPNPKEQVKKASALIVQGELEAALALIDEGLDKNPRALPLLLLRGHVLLSLRDYP